MTEPGILYFFYDYVDPASYLLEHRLRRLEGREDFSLVMEPLELSPPPAGLLDPNGEDWVRHWESMTKAGEEFGIELKRPWIVPWSRKAHELAFHAKKENCFREIHETLFRAYLLEGVDIGRVDVLIDLGRRHGLDPMETKAVLDIDLHRNSVMENRREALEAGVVRPPTLILNQERMEGYPEAESLKAFLASR